MSKKTIPKGVKKTLISLIIIAILAVAGYLVYDQYFKPNDNVSAEEIIDRTDKDIETINLKIDNIEAAMQIIQSNQTLTEDDVIKIKINMQEQIETLRTYQTLIQAVQDEVNALKELQGATQSNLQTFVTRLEHIENLVDSVISMTPSDEFITDMETVPVAGQIYFEAPFNGVLYIRIAVKTAGEIGMHLQAPNGIDLAYNTQKLEDFYIYNATFVMRQGQRIYCYAFSAGYDWGGYSFVKSITPNA